MSAAQPEQWLDPYPGFQYRDDVITVEAAHQHEKLAICGIPPTVFGDQVDPSFFIGIAIHAGIKSGITAEGNVNMLQGVRQHRPALLGEALTVQGEITDVKTVPRGRTLHTSVTFSDQQGQPVITATRVSLKPDPAKVGLRGAGERPPLVVPDTSVLALFNQYQLTPEIVKAYSSEGNSIHYEQAAAERAGFRAPLIGGGMGVHYLMAQLWDVQAPASFSMDIFFRRPIFWDEAVQVGMARDGQGRQQMALLKETGKVGTELLLAAT